VRLLPRDILATTSAVIVDAGNYYRSRDSLIAEIDRGLPDGTWVERLLGRPVVIAFNNIRPKSLATVLVHWRHREQAFRRL